MMASTGAKRRSVRQAATRKRSLYAEPDTDDDFEYDSDSPPDQQDLDTVPQPPPAKRQRTATTRPKRPHTRSSRRTTAPPSQALVKGIARPKKPNSHRDLKPRSFSGVSDGVVPAWDSLPISILRDIFTYASMPADGDHARTAANVDWLLRVARTCHAVCLPALEAYYQSPAMLTELHPHRLLETLKMNKEVRYMDYNRKVRSLEIDVRRLAYTALHKRLFDVSKLVAQLPQLQHLAVVHPQDKAPFRPLKVQKWHYPAQLFRTLDAAGTRLRSWRWNRDMIPIENPSAMYEAMVRTHTRRCFQTVGRLIVCGYNYDNSAEPGYTSVEDEEEQPVETSSHDIVAAPVQKGGDVTAPGLATSIALLPNLKDLTFISCDVIMDEFLERLPKNLERLELTNCFELTSEMLGDFLVESGSQLRELVLNHNPSLDLAFLPGLAILCPKLEVLTMDLQYYSERFNSNDAEPLYDELLGAKDPPSWPSTLRHLSLVHLQRCSAAAAQNLFRSLVEGAETLPDLRHLVLQAHIDIPWRERAGFRDQWIERLQRVYLRHCEPPNPFWGSLRQFGLWKEAEEERRIVNLAEDLEEFVVPNDLGDSDAESTAPFVQVTPAKHDGDTDDYASDSSSSAIKKKRPTPPQRRSQRVAASQASQSSASPARGGVVEESESESDSDSEEDEGDGEKRKGGDWRRRPEKFVQGLCDVVDVRIDNQRPRENQFTERDFLDSEASGDEDLSLIHISEPTRPY